MRAIPVLLGALAAGLAIAAAFLFLTYSITPPSSQPIVVPANEILQFPGGAHLGPSFSFAMWSLTVQNNSNETQRLVASLFGNGLPGDFQSITLNSSQRVSRTSCEGAARNGSNYTVSIIASSRTGSVNFSVPVTMMTATRVPFNGQVTVTNNLLNTSASIAGRTGAAEWNMTIENNGTRPITFFYATLYDPNASKQIFSLSSCPYPEYNGGQSRTVSPQSPLVQGQSLSVSSPLFIPGVTAGKTYSIEYVVGYSDGTEVVFTTSVQAK
ncbi:MAG: hypothetical protein LYZ70_07165 [Nitrososphaerales archaeon]|nr:hypothetical protein [Nitrososphaerales archaeon]